MSLNYRASALLFVLFCSRASAQAGVTGDENCRVILPDLYEKEHVKWDGACLDGYAEGQGTLKRFIKREQIGSFEGRMVRGQMSEGYEKVPGGFQYEGHYENGLAEGMGTSANAYGDIYTGMWKAGLKHGTGTISYGIGGEYSGEWVNNKPVGVGTIKYVGGMRIEEHVPFPEQQPVTLPSERFGLKTADSSSDDGEYGPSSILPFDKSYAELTPAQRSIVRRSYRLMHPDDEPPYPEQGSQPMSEVMYKWQALAPVDGRLVFHVLIDASGNPKSVTFIASPSPKLKDLVMLVVARMKFKPALCGGVPCEMKFPFCYAFVTR